MTTYTGNYAARPCDICKTISYLPLGQTRCGWCIRAYAAALRDAVEVIWGLEVFALVNHYVNRVEAREAIEALAESNERIRISGTRSRTR
jgi:hypothetical protein